MSKALKVGRLVEVARPTGKTEYRLHIGNQERDKLSESMIEALGIDDNETNIHRPSESRF